MSIPEATKNECRKRFMDLALILEAHGITWNYDLLSDLDLYISLLLIRKETVRGPDVTYNA